jgi:arylsulfatase A-like enzyme/predicted Zn-dependent protease
VVRRGRARSRPRRRAGFAVIAAVLVGAVALVLWRSPATRARVGLGRGGPSSLLLVSIDTLRADHLGCYGYAAAQTPRLDALASRGLRFEHAATVAPLTLPAHSSLMTGTFPARHGVRDNGGFYLGDEQTTLAETLRSSGYRTGGFVGAFVLDARWGIAQGFDRYFDDFDLSKYEGRGMDAVQRRGDEVVARALEWLDQEKGKPFFAWVHLYDPHTPYDAPEKYASRFPATPAGAYDAEIAWTDSLVGRLLDALETDGRLQRTLVVVVGDHGESLGEHREATHGFFVYEATLHVPLLISGGGLPARALADTVRIVDVMPTVLDLLGVPVPAAVQGRSLVPLTRGEHLELPALSESWFPRFHYGWGDLASLRDGRYKLIRAPRRELYDLADDPTEERDLASSQPARADSMERALAAMQSRVGGAGLPHGPQRIDSESEERLEALGYVSGTVRAKNLEERPRGDPKDKIDLYNLLRAAAESSIEGRLDEAVARVREALAGDPDIVEGYTLLGNLQAKAKRYDEAVAAYRKALALDPSYASAVFGLALVYRQTGRPEDAEAGFERMREIDPRATKALWQLADLWMQSGQFDRAETALKEALTRKVDRPSFLLKLGECFIEMKRYGEAEAALREALRGKPDLAGAHYDLGLVHEARGEVSPAMEEYQAEVARSPSAYRASFNLSKLLLQAGRPVEAVTHLRDAISAEPSFATAYLYLAKALLDAGRLREAEEAARHGLGANPDAKVAPLGHYVLADVYTRLGRPRDAARELSTAQRLERTGT